VAATIEAMCNYAVEFLAAIRTLFRNFPVSFINVLLNIHFDTEREGDLVPGEERLLRYSAGLCHLGRDRNACEVGTITFCVCVNRVLFPSKTDGSLLHGYHWIETVREVRWWC
jgi:hypothetical protein